MRRIDRVCRSWLVLLGSSVLLGACVTKEVGPRDGTSAVAPTLVVERFLNAANANDLETMGRLFGTANGAILERDDRANVEQRMYLVANILRHQDFRFAGEGIVPGRTAETTRLMVQMTVKGQEFVVPFTMVRSKKGWMIEQIGLDVITAAADAKR